MVSTAEQLGRIIAGLANDQEAIRQDAIPDESDASLIIAPTDKVEVTLSMVMKQQNYPTDAFILDHPVYCVLDSSTLKLDEGYGSSTVVTTYNS